MIEVSQIAQLDERSELLLFFLAFLESRMDTKQLSWLANHSGAGLATEDEVLKLCEPLQKIKFVRIAQRYYQSSIDVELIERFSPSAFSRLLQDSIERRWWRMLAYDDSENPVPQKRLSQVQGYIQDCYLVWYCPGRAFALRNLVSGRHVAVENDAYGDSEGYRWRAVSRCREIIDCSSAESIEPQFADGADLESVFKLLSEMFVREQNLLPLLTHIRRAVAAGGVRFARGEYCEFIALCIFTGHAEMIDGLPCGEDQKFAEFGQLAGLLRAGALADANALCGRMDKNPELAALDRPAYNLLALLVSAFAKPSPTRAVKYLRNFCPNENYRARERSGAENDVINGRNRIFKLLHTIIADCHQDFLVSEQHNSSLDTLSEPIASLLFGMNKKESARIASAMLSSAELAVKRGLPTVAGVFLTVFGWALPSAKADAVAALVSHINEAGGAWFRPFLGVASSWQRIVALLDERLPKTNVKKSVESAKVKSGRIFWGLTLDSDRLDVQPFFRGPRGADDGRDDKKVTLKSVMGGKYNDCLTDADREVIALLGKSRYDGPKRMYSAPETIIGALSAQSNVVRIASASDKEKTPPTPVRIVRREIQLTAKSEAGGGLAMSVPEAALKRFATHYIVHPEPDLYEYHAIEKDKLPLLEIFREFGEGGTIRLPEAAMERARPLLGRIAALIPMEGDLANAAGEAGLERLKGDPTPLVRLAMEESTLKLSLRVRPAAEFPKAVYEPGAGQSERTLAGPSGSCVLVRDLDEELRRAEEAAAALGDCETWREGAFDWAVDDPTAALEALSAVRALGAKVNAEWQPGRRMSVVKPRRTLTLGATAGADRWFTVSGECELEDGTMAKLAQILANLPRRVGRFVPLDERGYLELSRPLLRALEAFAAAGRGRKDRLLVSPAALPMLDKAFADSEAELALPKAMRVEADRIQAAFAERHFAPERLKAELRPYQEAGYQWLARLAACGLGACLADDMGLGKTVQLIALLLARASDGASLVVAPTSVAGNWRAEIRRFAPTLRPFVAGEGDNEDWLDVGAQDVVIVSYGLLVSRAEKFLSREWNGVVLDEAQAVKNADTERAKTVKKLRARFRTVATGTPIENRLTELWSIFDFLNPGLLGTAGEFAAKFTLDGRATPSLKNLVRPLVLRRLKREVLDDLPEKTEINLAVQLTGEERAGYEACRVAALETLERGGKESRISILAELMRLRRYCCHPSLVLPESAAGAKLDALMELLDELRRAKHRTLVFSQFTDFLAIVETRLKAEGFTYQYLDGATPPAERERRVAAFQRGDGDLFLMSLKAGGTGLNLTAANYVVLLDPWWNPAVEAQAADRVHRIGQRQPVTVYRLIATDTVEERVLELHREKKALAEDVLDGTGSAALTPEQLMKLFQ